MITDKQLRNKLFEFMFELLLSHGGDGDVVYKGNKWKENSDLFEKWLNKYHSNYLKRSNCEKHVTFHHDQECIYFVDNSFIHGCEDVICTERI